MAPDREPFGAPPDEPLFIAIKNDDPSMLAAYAAARRSVARFRHLIADLRGADTFHSAKLRFRDPDLSKRLGEDRYFFLWVSFVTCEGTGFTGRLFEVPKDVDWLKPNQAVRFEAEELFDWMVNDEGHLFGGFRLRVNRDNLPEARRAAFDRYVGVRSYEAVDADQREAADKEPAGGPHVGAGGLIRRLWRRIGLGRTSESPLKENETGGYRELARRSQGPARSATTSADDAVVPVFIPALVALLLNLEREKGTPLTEEEVLGIRDQGVCMTMRRSMARSLAESRGYDDIDPENVWPEWQVARAEFATGSEEPE